MKVKHTIELKKSLEGFNNKLDQVEEKISKLEDRPLEIIQPEKKKEWKKQRKL